jgi:hypothetical protein
VSVTIFDAASSIGNPLKGEKSVNGDLHVKMPPPGNVSWMNRSAENWIAEREREREGERGRERQKERERERETPPATHRYQNGRRRSYIMQEEDTVAQNRFISIFPKH